MKTQSAQMQLPLDGTSATSPPVDTGSGRDGITVQFVGIAGAGTYKIELSLDEGVTWVDITKQFTNLNTGVALSADVSADGIYACTRPLPGLVRILASHTGTGTPLGYINFQDSRTE